MKIGGMKDLEKILCGVRNNMEERTVLIEKKNNIAVVSLNRADKLNVFNEKMFVEYEEILKSIDKDNEVKVVILNGKGKAFCTGIELNILNNKDPDEIYQQMQKFQKITSLTREISKPVIAMVQDLAIAFGIGLVAASDIVVAAKGARFGATAINIGLFCMGPGVFLVQNIGIKKTFELLFTGKIIDAEEALRIGLVNKIVSLEDLEKETISLAEEIAKKDIYALSIGKRFFYKMFKDQTEFCSELASHYFSLLYSKWKNKTHNLL